MVLSGCSVDLIEIKTPDRTQCQPLKWSKSMRVNWKKKSKHATRRQTNKYNCLVLFFFRFFDFFQFVIWKRFNVSIGKDRSKSNFPHTCLETEIQGKKEPRSRYNRRQYNKLKWYGIWNGNLLLVRALNAKLSLSRETRLELPSMWTSRAAAAIKIMF